MKIIRKGVMTDGTDVQIEDWSEDYPGTYARAETVAAYPVAKKTHWRDTGSCNIAYPRERERFRASFDFGSEEAAAAAFAALLTSAAKLKDYVAHMHDPQYAECL
jgi:hypothetical protein